MGFLISNYTLLGIPLQNVYVSIKGRYSILNSNFIYGIPNRYQIYADYWFSTGVGQPTVQCSGITINTDQIPANIYFTIYEEIKKVLDPKYQTEEQTLGFVDE